MEEKILQGKRIYSESGEEFPRNPGEYMKQEDGTWLLCLPTGIHGTINDKIWKIEEHEDGAITVSPSISTKATGADKRYDWHGFLEKGVFRSC